MANDIIMRGKDRLHEISMKLEQSHLVYLQTDDSPLKLQQRHKLEGFIKEYLCLVPNENKYVFQETADILHRSAATLTDFSGYRAATAWSAISLYAANLLAQPWRKEYRIVRTYSGYYKHEVEANLIGAELMFEQMGYKHTGLGILTLEGPIDPDKVSNVSRDAIVAFVECQILKQIWESVSQKYTISWLEVLEFRENHVGTPEQAIRALNYRFLEKVHQNRTKVDNYKDYYQQQMGIDVLPLHLPYHHIVHANYNTTMPSTCQTDYRHIEDTTNMAVPTNYRYYQPLNHGFINCCTSYGCLPSHGNKFYGNSTQPNPYCATLPAYAARVPTGRLIELDVPVSVANYEKTHTLRKPMSHRISDLDEIDFYKRQSSNGDHYEHGKTDRKTASRSNSSAGKDGYDTWDFVYRNLESLGYYKDLDDRDDVLQHKKELDSIYVKHKTLRQTENEDKYSAHKSEKKRSSGRIEANEIDSSETNGKNHQDILPFKKKSSSFDLSDSNRYNIDANYKDKKHNSQTLPIPRTHKSSDQIAKKIADSFKNLDIAQMSKQKKEEAEDEKRWNCATCTYLNMPDRDICEMCAKSRCKGNEDKPLASGGKECPKCTLVNEKNVSICDACHTSLKDSPTYI
ncbi:Protein tamozhennic [Trachymyrmex septentrionalis]|uniref:Protein tamozhennic n=1 Tax=Trachymyrmex septentrionalis TaxID=34720 RepID=A0A195FL60_9HYME|nr:PREDICTED: protein tamozhennic [Trachymyrmex septentrionalis]KYN40724.1 Protein tamozhennic [Trachymyrmex septentrionalis]